MADSKRQRSAGDRKTKKRGVISQMRQIYTFTYGYDKALPWLLALAFLAPVILAVVIGAVVGFSLLSWILTVITGVMLGFLLATITLTRRADVVGYRQMEGRPGATGAILSNINKGGFHFPQEPVWIDMKTKDAVWRGSGRNGVFLIGEGDYARVSKAVDREEVKVRRITRGSAIPIHKFSVGHGEKQVPLPKLRRTILRQKVKLTTYELEQLNDRLNTLQQRSGLGMPPGIDPTKVHVSRRALRGR